ncbi:MAG: 30S ribosomal protein S12 methylthiotransferase RimO [Proteobacteria bacterium]|nr:30S ribosomal protein S12 methylthiotransferase RimO [Desulfobulbaceae bacterium]MBU4153459.1 30S ribosomal protein S12 methylthiotransferase RimO [Pseudomonadota bacterium]
MNKNVFIVSLGCPKNLVDSEIMLGLLASAGYQTCAEPEEAQVILVNTCGFVQSAAEEAVDEILQLVEVKKQRPGTLLVVTGCLVQRYGQELMHEMPEVDLFLGTESFADIVARIEAIGEGHVPEMANLTGPPFLMTSAMPRLISTPIHRAYLKITEGCSNACSYCMIPSIRGRLRSRDLDDVVSEARRLERLGVKELTLIGQDLTAYGLDLASKDARLPELLTRLLQETDIPWLRTLYLYPQRITDHLLQVIAENDRLLPYLDIPFQHVSPSILRLMNRPSVGGALDELMARIRHIVPQAAIRTTFIVGFPGETEADVVMLEDFLQKHLLDHVGVFSYSNEEGSAAAKLPDHCPEEVKEERLQRLMELQAGISLAKNLRRVGTIEQVLVEGVSAETDLLVEGRLRSQAPDIDGCVYINAGECAVGDLVDVEITEAHTYDLVGEIVDAV